MVASSSIADPSALVCEAMPTMNVTAEGYPGARFHAGCRHIDEIEQLAIDRAKQAFGACYANVQPMSATSANEVVMFSVLEPHDTLMGLELDSEAPDARLEASISGQVFRSVGYGLTRATSASTTTRPRHSRRSTAQADRVGTTPTRARSTGRGSAPSPTRSGLSPPTSRTSRGSSRPGCTPRPSTTRTSPRPARTSSSTAGAAG
jgi:hypothetical protein